MTNVKAISNTNGAMAGSAVHFTPSSTANCTFTFRYSKRWQFRFFLSVKAVTNEIPEPDKGLDYLLVRQLVR